MDYQKHYDNLISSRKNRERLSGHYYEKHHIVMKSMGGVNDKENLIYLTAREHFIAHWLLWRIYKNKQSAGAFFSLCIYVNRKTREKVKISSRVYEEAKLAHSTFMSRLMKGVKNPESSKKSGESRRGKCYHDPWNKGKKGWLKHSEESKKKISESIKKLERTLEHNKKIGNSHVGLKHPHTEQTKIHFREILSGKGNPRAKKLLFISPENIEFVVYGGMSNFCKEHRLNYGYVSQILNHKRENNLKEWKIFQL